jgi:hypothetical protein
MPEDVVPAAPLVPPTPRVRLRWRWAKRLGIPFVLLLVVVWFLPAIAAMTGQVNRLVARNLADFNGTVRVGDASLGWFSAVELRDVTVTDAEGRPLLVAGKITTSKSLLRLATGRADLGTITLERPTIEVVSDKEITNVERAIAKYLEGPAGTGGRPALAVHVADATLTIHDADRKRTHTLTGVTADVAIPPGAEAIAVRVHAEAGAARLDADLSFGPETTVKLVAHEFPLEAIESFVRRADSSVALAGRLTADATAGVAPAAQGPPAVRVKGTVAIADLEVASPRLGPEPLRLQRVELPCSINTVGSQLQVEKAELTCDLGTASASGTLDLSEPPEKWLDRPGLTASADADLAAIARRFPKLLRVRDGLELREGRIRAELASKPGPGTSTWEGSLKASALKAVRGGKPLTWDQPLEIGFAGRVAPNRVPVFDRLDAKAEFATISARGSPEQFFATADVSLDKLAARLSQFIDLGGLNLAGSARLEVSVKPKPKGGSALRGTVRLTQFAYADGPHQLREPNLVFDVTADGKFDAEPVRLDAGRMTLNAGVDSLDLRLLEPVAEVRALKSGKAAAEVSGDLARWLGRAARFVEVPADWRLAGTGKVAGTVRVDAGRIALEKVTGDLSGVKFTGAGLTLDEPQVRLFPTDATIDRATGRIETGQLLVSTQTVGLATQKVVFARTPAGYAVTSTVFVNANLGRLQRALQLQTDPKLGDEVAGMVRSGSIAIENAGGKYRFKAWLPVENFAYGPPQKPTWAEPKLTLAADSEYDPTADSLRLDSAKVERPQGLAVQAKGSVAKLSTTQDLAIDGKLTYDLSLLEPQLRTYLGQSAKAVGKDTRDFRIRGPLSAPVSELSGNAAVAWQSLRVYGFDLERAELKAKLEKGILRIDPIEAAFGQAGKARIEPAVKFAPTGSVLTLAKGKVVDHAKLTPAATADALGYALPTIAKSSETEGTISFDLDEGAVPLADPDKAKVAGRLTLHQVQVGPGPVVSEIATLFSAKPSKLTLANEQVVPVRMENGLVYHEGLTLTANGFTLKTSGSVGVDSTLDLVAEVPVPDSAVGSLLKNYPRVKEAVEKHRFKVPVWGTIAKPKLDERAFRDAVRRYLEDVAKDAAKGKLNDLIQKEPGKIEKEVEKQLDKLFPPKK